jgi:hypothetical protein
MLTGKESTPLSWEEKGEEEDLVFVRRGMGRWAGEEVGWQLAWATGKKKKGSEREMGHG